MIEDFNQASLLIDHGSVLMRIATAGVAVAGLALSAAYVVPKIVDGLLPSPHQDALHTFLPVKGLLSDGKTIRFENNFYARVIDMVGADLALASTDQKIGYFNSRKRMIDELERLGLTEVKFFHIKDRVSLERTLKPANAVLRAIDDRWEASSPEAYNMTHAAVLIMRNKKESDATATLDSAETTVMATMAAFKPRVMVERPDGGGTSPLTPLARVLSPISKPKPRARQYNGPIAALMTGDDKGLAGLDRALVHGRRCLAEWIVGTPLIRACATRCRIVTGRPGRRFRARRGA